MSKNLDDLRETLFATIEAVRSGTMELEKAKTINEIGRTITDTAKVEVAYINAVGGKSKSNFIPAAAETPRLPSDRPANGISSITQQLQSGPQS